jgi:Cd27 binding protein (Siva).
MPKRLCPFSGSDPRIKTHVDMRHVGKEDYAKEVCQKTTQMLMDGARDARKEELKLIQEKKKSESNRGKVNIGPVFKVLKEKSGCYFCKHKDINDNIMHPLMNSLNSCSYCNKNICRNTCSKDCVKCGFVFCPSCIEIKYGHFEDLILCINCSESFNMV